MTFSQRHYRSVSPASDKPEDIAWRIKRNAVLEQVRAEMKLKYPTITADNFIEANDYQNNRIAELMGDGTVRLIDRTGA